VQYDAAFAPFDSSRPALFSGYTADWIPAGAWWKGNSVFEALSAGQPIFRQQRVTLHPDAVYAAIGVTGGAGAVLRSLRLYAPPGQAPAVIFGGSHSWGFREYTASLATTVPALAPGATAFFDVNVPGVRQGDFVQAGFARPSGFWNGGLIFHASVGGIDSADQVRVTVLNLTGNTIQGSDGTLFVRAVKPKL
jgi:hypothetical protein